MSWGYHLILNCRGGNISKITSSENVKNFSRELVQAIDMVAYGEPIVEHFATHDPDKAGISLVQLIETSNICAHFVDKNGDFYVDIFSCKEYDIETAVRVVQKYFEPTKIARIYLERDA
jgi:S-adenosylmethionine decarboxylase